MNKRNYSFLFRLLSIASLTLGIILNISRTTSITKILAYYTLQINILCLLANIIFEIADILKFNFRKYSIYYFIKGEMIVSVLLMMIIYEVTLVPSHFQMYKTPNKFADLLVHIISPTVVIVDYFLLDEKGNFKLYYPIIWIIVPLMYVIFVYTYSYFGGTFYYIGGSRKYAYTFLDIEKYGYEKVFIWIFLLTIGVIAIGYILFFLDKKLAKRAKRGS